MSNGKITQIYEAFVEDDVNRYLADGWMIVAVVSGTRIYNGKEEIGPVYVCWGCLTRRLSPQRRRLACLHRRALK